MNDLSFVQLSARPELLPVLVDWFETEWPDDFAGQDAESHFRAQMKPDSVPMTIVAVASETPVGTVALRGSGPSAEPGAWLGGLYVHPELRGQGIGTALVRVVVTLAWQLQHTELFVATELDEFFARIGFELVRDDAPKVLKLTRPETYYDRIGGEAGTRRLVDRFYDIMDEVSEAADVRAMHAPSLKISREKLFKFLSGWLGGPSLYVAEYGHPRLRGRHLPFSIGTDARDQWMICMNRALAETVEDVGLREELSNAFAGIANQMRNREGA